MLIDHSREKLINAIIYFVKNTKKCGLTKLLKLLYFLDFIHFRETGRSVTGNIYSAWEKGPVPSDLWRELKDPKDDILSSLNITHPTLDEWQTEFMPKRKFSNRFFTKRELRIMEDLAYIFKNANAKDMSEITHLKGTPWQKTCMEKGEGAEIDYFLALDGEDDRQLSKDELEARIEEITEARRALG